MKKKLFSSKIKTLLIVAVTLAVVTTVITAVVGGTTFSKTVFGDVLSPLRSGVAAIDRAAQFSPFAALTGYEQALEVTKEQAIDRVENEVETEECF